MAKAWAMAAATAVVLSGFATTSAPAADAAEPAPIITEISSAEDWIEVYNPGAVAVSLDGWKVGDDTKLEDLPAGVVVAPGSYTVLRKDVDFTFGLGKSDTARLLDPDGAEQDRWDYPSEPATTWGRCPDPRGAFVVTAAPTPGDANQCAASAADAVRINEIESSDSGAADWVELVNVALAPVDAGGLLLKDSGEGNTVAVPAASVIEPGGFLAVDVTGLGSGDSARLLTADGAVVDTHTWTAHADKTYGRCPDGIGAFVDTDAATKGAANQCPAPAGADAVRINEVESNGGTPGDWVELVNTGAEAVDLTGWVIGDNDDTHRMLLPAGTTIAAGGFAWFQTDAGAAGFGLGSSDAAKLFLPDAATLVDSYAWTAHAATSYGRCPDGSGAFITTVTTTRAAANDCEPVRISEVESSGGTPGDWIELANLGAGAVDVSGYVLRDDDDTHQVTLPAGTAIAAGGYLAVDVDAGGGFGLGSADSARLFRPDGTTLVDQTSWTTHPATSYGRCPDLRSGFESTLNPTKGAANECRGVVPVEPWPGPAAVVDVDSGATVFSSDGQDMSGLTYEGTGTADRGILWAVNNGSGNLFALEWTGSAWEPRGGEWAGGKALRYPGGTGAVDAEGVALGSSGAGAVYVASERDNTASGTSRPSVLRYDATAPGTTLVAAQEWNLATLLPPLGANAGLEGIAWIPDAALTAAGFTDTARGEPYDPADYPGHGDGVVVVGVEGTAMLYVVVLGSAGDAQLLATIDPGLDVVAEVVYDGSTGALWAFCDDACAGRSAVLEIPASGDGAGAFAVTARYENPEGMADSIANEGVAFGTPDLCVGAVAPVFYADDNGTDGTALREGRIDCLADPSPTPTPTTTPTPTAPLTPTPDAAAPAGPSAPDAAALVESARGGVTGPDAALPGQVVTVQLGADYAGDTVYGWLFSTPTPLGAATVSASGAASFTIPADTPPGAHRLAVTDAAGVLIGWLPVQVAALAATGAPDVRGWLAIAALLVVAGALLTLRRRPQP